MKLIKYLKTILINPCKGCMVDPMCSRVCDKLTDYINGRENVIATIIVMFGVCGVLFAICGLTYIISLP